MKYGECISKGKLKSVYVKDGQAKKVFDKSYSKSDVLYEALNTARVEDAGVEIPKLISVDVEDGQWVITSEFIEGKTLAELIKENPKKADSYIKKMVDLQIEIHTKTNPLLVKLKDKISRQINGLDEIDGNVKYDLLTRLEGMPKHTKLCHGDFSPDNIIVTDKGKLYAVDWVHATQGNASADVARTYLLLALDNIKLADKYLDTFCEKTGTTRQYVQNWLPIVAAAQLEKKRPDERELLLKWANVVDFQ
jgi:RIO-like serine/threonine protein kinase